MTLRTRVLLGVLVFVILGAFLFRFGKPVWRPLVAPFVGEKTVSSVLVELEEKGLGFSPEEKKRIESITLVAIKKDRVLEVWVRETGGGVSKIEELPFSAFSGKLGPKLREGDFQIPEGIYRIASLNPNSSYHLSMELDYPNAFDRAKAEEDGRENLGFDIFVHGKAATVGCIPLGDPGIEKLFAWVAGMGKKRCNVTISPVDFRRGEDEPVIDEIQWESELYGEIKKALSPFRS